MKPKKKQVYTVEQQARRRETERIRKARRTPEEREAALVKERANYYKRAERCREYAKNWHKLNPEKSKANKERWIANSVEERKEYEKNRWITKKKEIGERTNKRYKTDPQFNISKKLRARFWKALKTAQGEKTTQLFDLVGISVDQLRSYIEQQFTEQMNWDLLLTGEIHIDHKKPCASFDLIDESQQKECFHYTNLQPLWKSDNVKKSSKHEGKFYRHSDHKKILTKN